MHTSGSGQKTPIFCLNWLFEILPANSTTGNRNLTKSSSFYTHPHVCLWAAVNKQGQQKPPTHTHPFSASFQRNLEHKPNLISLHEVLWFTACCHQPVHLTWATINVSAPVPRMKIRVSQMTSTYKILFPRSRRVLGCILKMQQEKFESLPALPVFSCKNPVCKPGGTPSWEGTRTLPAQNLGWVHTSPKMFRGSDDKWWYQRPQKRDQACKLLFNKKYQDSFGPVVSFLPMDENHLENECEIWIQCRESTGTCSTHTGFIVVCWEREGGCRLQLSHSQQNTGIIKTYGNGLVGKKKKWVLMLRSVQYSAVIHTSPHPGMGCCLVVLNQHFIPPKRSILLSITLWISFSETFKHNTPRQKQVDTSNCQQSACFHPYNIHPQNTAPAFLSS